MRIFNQACLYYLFLIKNPSIFGSQAFQDSQIKKTNKPGRKELTYPISLMMQSDCEILASINALIWLLSRLLLRRDQIFINLLSKLSMIKISGKLINTGITPGMIFLSMLLMLLMLSCDKYDLYILSIIKFQSQPFFDNIYANQFRLDLQVVKIKWLIMYILSLNFQRNQLHQIYFIQFNMGNPNLDLELSSLIQSLTKASLILYEFYGLEIKVVGLLLLAIVSFKLGKKSVVDPLEEEVKQMNLIMKTRQQYTIVIPNKIRSLGTKNTILFATLIIAVIAYFAMAHFKPEIVHKVDPNIYILAAGIFFAIVVLLWFYQLFLKFKLSRGKFNDHYIIQKIGNIVKMLGSKAQILLQYFLCKDAYNKYKTRPTQGCNKEKCRDYRLILDEKLKGISIMLHNVINFEWCVACKKKQPFDEYLDYQETSYNEANNENQEEEVKNKNNYLLKEVEKMAKWVKDIGPCNCSKRYWNESRKEISQFKKRERQLEPMLAQFEQKKK